MKLSNSSFSFWVGHNNRKNLHSPTIRILTPLSSVRKIKEIGRQILTEHDLVATAEDLWKESVGVTTKAEIDEICLMTFSVSQ